MFAVIINLIRLQPLSQTAAMHFGALVLQCPNHRLLWKRQDVSCMYLAHHELESDFTTIVIIIIVIVIVIIISIITIIIIIIIIISTIIVVIIIIIVVLIIIIIIIIINTVVSVLITF